MRKPKKWKWITGLTLWVLAEGGLLGAAEGAQKTFWIGLDTAPISMLALGFIFL